MRLGVTDLFIVNEGIKRRVAEYKTHPKYQGRAYFDVGIAVADKIIEFNARIMPICLPMRPVDDTDALANDFVNLAGWGLSINSQGKYELDAKMKLANLQVNSKELCGGIFNNKSLDARSLQRQIPNGFTSDITCVGNSFDVKEGACDGDSGSPVIKRIIGTARGKPYFEQHFIVSTGIDCKLEATIYARVTNRRILNWIQQVTETTPVLMVAGGYSDFNEYGPGLTNDIEIISGKDKRACSKAVRPLEGELIELEDDYGAYYADSASAVGITGYFVKDAPILCGGKNAQDNLNACFEMDLKTNE